MSSVMLGSMSDAELTWVNKDDQTWMLSTLTYNTGKNKKTVPVSEVARITQEPMSGSLVFEFKDGTSDYLENGGDEKGVSEFVGQAQRYVS